MILDELDCLANEPITGNCGTMIRREDGGVQKRER